MILAVQKQPGADTLVLARKIESVLNQLQEDLPQPIVLEREIFKQADFIEAAMANVSEAVRDGALWVIVVLFIFMWNFRVSISSLTAMPLSILMTVLVFRYFGLSNFRAWRIAEICSLCGRMGVELPVVLQPYYNALNRMPEVEVLPACSYYGLGVAPYSPVARGVLTGKYLPGAPPPEGTRAGRADTRMMQTEWREESLVIAQKIKEHATARGISPVQFAVAWVLNNRLVTSPIVGPRTEEHMRDYLGAVDYRFTAEDEALVDGLVPAGHPSTPGYTDPAYPLEGRVARTAG